MEKNTLIAVISIGFVSITALVLSIIGVSRGGHECGFERGGMMGRENMIPGNMQGQKGMMNNQHMKLLGSGAIPGEQAEVE